MKRWNPIPIIAAVMMLTLMIAPVCAEDTEAASGDIVLYSNTTSIGLLSDNSKTLQVIVSNNTSSSSYDVRMTSSHNSEFYSVSYDVREFVLEAGAIKTVNITLTSDKYSEKVEDVLSISAECFALNSTPTTANTITVGVTTYSEYNNEDSFNKILGLFENNLPEPMNSPMFTAVITFLIWIVLGTALSFAAVLLIYYLLFRKQKDNVGDAKVRLNQMRKFFFGIVLLYGLANTMNVYGIDVNIVGKFTELSEFLLVIFLGVIVWKIVRVKIESVGRRLGEDGRFDPSIIPLFLMIAEVIVIAATVSVSLAVYGVDFMAIIAGLGLLTTGISFGAKNIINQFLSGVILLAERPFVSGDKIKLSTDKSTTLVVNQVGFMTTRFKNWSNEEIIFIPNNAIINSTMTNMTRDNVLYRVYDYFTIAYSEDISKAKSIMLAAAMDNSDVICDTVLASPEAHFDSVNRNEVVLRLSFIVNDHENYGGIAGRIRYEIFRRFEEEGVDIPYEQYTLNLVRVKRTDDEANSA